MAIADLAKQATRKEARMPRYYRAIGECLAAVGLFWSASWVQELAAGPPQSTGSQDVRPNDVAGPMQLKLKHVEKVLEGIAREDFVAIAKNAEQLGLLSQDENWQVYQTPEYRLRSAEFQRIAAELTTSAKRKNIDESALAYLQMTMCCVNCHKHTRSLRGDAAK
jgi:hypothetical protein